MPHPDGAVARAGQQCVLLGLPQLHRRAGPRGGRDPLAFRLELLGDKDMMAGTGERGVPYNVARMRGVLQAVAEKSGWGSRKFARGQGAGVAFHFSHRGYVAEVAEVTVSKDGRLTVDRVVVVTDIGAQIVNLSAAPSTRCRVR
jgi:isoquinoline 1-oxidoreductase beta subunit